MDQNLIAGFLFDAVGWMRPAHRPAPLIDSGLHNPKTQGRAMSDDLRDLVKYEAKEGRAYITFCRDEKRNALTYEMFDRLMEHIESAERDDDVWLLVVTGAGRAFCSGADLNGLPSDGTAGDVRPYLSTYDQWEAPQEGTPPFRTMAKPILAAINGLCCGAGLDLVTTSDIVIASEEATFFDPH